MKKTIAICFFCVAFFFFVPDLSANSDLRPLFSTYLLEPKDQGARPTCSPSAIATLLEFEYNKHAINHPIILSIEYLNWAANEVTGTNQDGSLFTTLIKGLEVKGVCQETKMPYQASFDPDITPSSEALNDAETRRQYHITWIKNLNAYTGMTQYQIDEIKKLINIGYPVAIGSRWPTNPIFDSNHVLSEIPSGNEVFDGHSVVIVGYFDDNDYPGGGVFIIRNSSGSSWQDNGHAKIPYEYYKLYGNDALALARQVKPGASFRVKVPVG